VSGHGRLHGACPLCWIIVRAPERLRRTPIAVKTCQWANRLVQDTSRGPSNGLWYDCPLEDFIQNFGGGISTPGTLVQDEFEIAGQPALNANSDLGQWACWADTGSLFTDANEEGGVVLLNAAVAGKSIVLASNAGGFKIVSGASGFPLGQKMWFECRVALASIASTVNGCFVGLADNTGSQITSANNTLLTTTADTFATTKGIFGFQNRCITSPTDWSVVYNVAGGTVQYPTNLQTLVNTVTGSAAAAYAAVTNGNGTGFVKLGFVFDPTAGNPAQIISSLPSSGQTAGNVAKPLIQFFVNGQLCGTFLTSTNVQAATFPVKRMSPVIEVMQASGSGTVAGAGLYVDWIRCAQFGSF
jgi:hypothetical protein